MAKRHKDTGLTEYTYSVKRSKRGTLDRNGKPLSDFMRGKYAGKAA